MTAIAQVISRISTREIGGAHVTMSKFFMGPLRNSKSHTSRENESDTFLVILSFSS